MTLRSLLLLLVLWAPDRFALYSHPFETVPALSETSNCAAPPPSDFHVSVTSVSSITLKWTENTPGLYYFLSGTDLTTSMPLPNVITQGDTYTYGSLPPGHDFVFFIGASYCPQGPPGGKTSARGSTIIISDIVINMTQCEPDMNKQITVGESFMVTVPRSITPPNQPLNNGYVAEFRYVVDNQEFPLKFGLVYNYDESTVYFEELHDPVGRYSLKAFNMDGLAGECCLGSYNSMFCSLPIFRIVSVAPDQTNQSAVLEVVFQQPVSGYKHCSQGAGTTPALQHVKAGSVASANVHQKTGPEVEKSLQIGKPSPNPFTRFSRLEYQLETEGPVTILLYDAMGRLVQEIERNTPKPAGRHALVVDGAGLPNGVYYLQIRTQFARESFPLVKF